MVDLKSALIYPEDDVRRYIDEGAWTDIMPHQVLADWAAKTPDRAALIAPDVSRSYAQLYDQARRFASGLIGLGLGPGEVIGFQLPNIAEFMVAYLGTQMIGAVPCMFHMPYRVGELEPLIAHARPSVIICMAADGKYDAPGLMAELWARSDGLETIIVIGGEAPEGCQGFAELAASEIGEISNPPGPDDAALMLFTSGTSAMPKAVVHAHRTLSASCLHTAVDMGFTESDVVLCAPAFTLAFGLCIAVTIVLAGGANAMMPAYSPVALAETIARSQSTVVCCGPAHIQAGFKADLWGADITASLKRVYTGGALCPPETLTSLDAVLANGKVHQVWGMTEVLMPIIHPLGTALDVRASSLGTPPTGHEVRIVDENGVGLDTGQEGELEMRGPFLMAGYFGNDQANKDSFTDDGWFRTGDIAVIDERGFVTLTGRVKDVINRGGMKINPVDIEALMDAHPSVLLSAVVPMPDEVLGERACLFLQTVPGETPSLEEVCAYLAEKDVAKLRWPERLVIVEAMPMTATRKIIKGRLVELL